MSEGGVPPYHRPSASAIMRCGLPARATSIGKQPALPDPVVAPGARATARW